MGSFGGCSPPCPHFDCLVFDVRSLRSRRCFRIGARGNGPVRMRNGIVQIDRTATKKSIVAVAVDKRVIDLRSVVPTATTIVCVTTAAQSCRHFSIFRQYAFFDIRSRSAAERKPSVDVAVACLVIWRCSLHIMLSTYQQPAQNSFPCAALPFTMKEFSWLIHARSVAVETTACQLCSCL